MNTIRFALAGIGIALLFTAGPVVADTETIRALARIAMSLDHYPSGDDKVILKAIIDSDDSSEEEAAIAMALSNIDNKVRPADAERLADIVDDDLSDASARRLAEILLRINHSPGDDDKVELAALAEE